jgi:hypothetical protein
MGRDSCMGSDSCVWRDSCMGSDSCVGRDSFTLVGLDDIITFPRATHITVPASTTTPEARRPTIRYFLSRLTLDSFIEPLLFVQ